MLWNMCTGDESAVALVQAGLAAISATDPADLPDQPVRDEVLALLRCVNQLSATLATRLGK